MVSRITDSLWSNTTWWANSTVYISEGTHKASRVQGCSAVSWEAQRTCKRTATIVPGHNLLWMLCLYSRQNKRPKGDPRREQQTLTIQFLTLLMSNSSFSSFLKPRGFLHFLELCQGVGMHVGVEYQECTLEANMVGPRKNCQMLSHTLPLPQHFFLSLGFCSL